MNSPGRVLHLSKAYPPWIGGIERHLSDIATEQAARGWHVDVLVGASHGTPSLEVRQGVHVHRAGTCGWLWSQPIAPGYLRLCRRLARLADAIHLHVPHPLGQLATLGWTAGRPLIVTWHSDIVRQRLAAPLLRPLERASLRRASRVIATSPRYAETSPPLRSFSQKVEVIPLGLDVDRFDDRLRAAERQAMELQNRLPSPVTLCVGRAVPYKGIEHLLRAFQTCPGSLVLVGDGPLRRHLLELARRLRIADRCFFEPELSDLELAARYRAADLFVLPSTQRSEAFGLVQLEAFAARVPVVCTDLPTGVPWVNRHGETGLVVKPASPDELACAIRSLLEDVDRRESFGEAARRHLESNFRLSHVVTQLEEAYNQLG